MFLPKTLIVERVGSNNDIGLITLNRPESLNAFNRQQFSELAQALNQFDQDASIKVIVLTGNEKAFSAGMDLKGYLKFTLILIVLEALKRQGQQPLGQNNEDLINLTKIQKPVIGAINGFAFGAGCEVNNI